MLKFSKIFLKNAFDARHSFVQLALLPQRAIKKPRKWQFLIAQFQVQSLFCARFGTFWGLLSITFPCKLGRGLV